MRCKDTYLSFLKIQVIDALAKRFFLCSLLHIISALSFIFPCNHSHAYLCDSSKVSYKQTYMLDREYR